MLSLSACVRGSAGKRSTQVASVRKLYCRQDAKLQYNFLTDATCVDRFPAEPRFELNYHLVSIPRREKVRLRVWLSGNDPVVDSLVHVWPGANWLEREIFDLFGIRFSGHPDLR